MKKNEVKTGETYRVKVSGKLADVRLTGENANGGWDGVNVATNRKVRVKSAHRLRGLASRPAKRKKIVSLAEYEVGAKASSATSAKTPAKTSKDAKSPTKHNTDERGATSGKKMSLLDAAAHILSLGAALPMRCQDIVKLAIDRNLWTPGVGKTPASSLHAAISREIKTKGDDSRFRKAERGKFEINLVA